MAADIVLAASAREWPDRLHRFLLDHGGGRIVDRLMAGDMVGAVSCDVVLIDDICSFLSPRLVSTIKGRGAEVIGVYDPTDGSDAKRRLLECGISDVIESEATAGEFVEKIGQALAHRVRRDPTLQTPQGRVVSIAVTGPCEGVGMTEVAVALSRSLSSSVDTVLMDLDQNWPSIAQRLDLPVHPNVRTALDHVMHTPHRLVSSLHEMDGLSVVGGRADGGRGARVTRHEAVALLEGLVDLTEVVVADIGPASGVEKDLLNVFDTVVVVGTASPVGIGRLLKIADQLLGSDPDRSLLGVINMVSSSSYRGAEARAEVARTMPSMPVVCLPYDSKLEDAAWNGTLSYGKRYQRAIRAMSAVVVESLS